MHDVASQQSSKLNNATLVAALTGRPNTQGNIIGITILMNQITITRYIYTLVVINDICYFGSYLLRQEVSILLQID